MNSLQVAFREKSYSKPENDFSISLSFKNVKKDSEACNVQGKRDPGASRIQTYSARVDSINFASSIL